MLAGIAAESQPFDHVHGPRREAADCAETCRKPGYNTALTDLDLRGDRYGMLLCESAARCTRCPASRYSAGCHSRHQTRQGAVSEVQRRALGNAGTGHLGLGDTGPQCAVVDLALTGCVVVRDTTIKALNGYLVETKTLRRLSLTKAWKGQIYSSLKNRRTAERSVGLAGCLIALAGMPPPCTLSETK